MLTQPVNTYLGYTKTKLKCKQNNFQPNIVIDTKSQTAHFSTNTLKAFNTYNKISDKSISH